MVDGQQAVGAERAVAEFTVAIAEATATGACRWEGCRGRGIERTQRVVVIWEHVRSPWKTLRHPTESL